MLLLVASGWEGQQAFVEDFGDCLLAIISL